MSDDGSAYADQLQSSVVDYNLESLYNLLRSDSIELRPGYQRRFRWDEKRQSRLVESFLLNMPVPPIYLSEDREGKYYVIDGQQRLSAVGRFFAGELKLRGLELIPECNGKRYDDLPIVLQRRFRYRANLRAIIILEKSDPKVALRVFERLNMGTEKLNHQEIRNSMYSGPLNQRLTDLSENPLFVKLIWRGKDRLESKTYKNMRDIEFVLRFFTFSETWDSFTGLMSAHMDNFMREHRDQEGDWLDAMSDRFLNSLRVVEAAFGDFAFRRWRPEKEQFDPSIRSAVYDAEILGCQGFDPDSVRARRAQIQGDFKTLCSDAEFVESLVKGSNHSLAVRLRAGAVRDIISNRLA